MSNKNPFIDDSFKTYITFDKFEADSQKAIEELEKMNDYQKIVDGFIVYYCSLLRGYNRMFTFHNHLLYTVEYFYEENVVPELEIKKVKTKNYKNYIDDGPSYIQYYDNGKIFCMGWYEDGKVYRNKKPNFPAYITYYYDGNKEQEVFYNKDGQIHRSNDYAWVVFDKKGELQHNNCEYYINGLVIKKSEWNNYKCSLLCDYCKNNFSTKYRLQDHFKVCGAKKLLDDNKELKVFLECKQYYKEIFDFIAQKASLNRDYELIRIMKENNI